MVGNDAIQVAPVLSAEQERFFKTFGYLLLKQLFTPEEVQTLAQEFSNAFSTRYAHHPFDGTERHYLVLLGEDTPFFASLIEDPRIYNVARQLFGEDILGITVDGNRYVGDTSWHMDTASLLQYGIKFAIYMKPVDAMTGALRVIPATHRLPLDDPEFKAGVRALPIEDVPAEVLKSEPGDVVAFDVRLWHGSHGGSNDRPMCTVVYYNDPKTPEAVEHLVRQAAGNAKAAAQEFRGRPTREQPYFFPKKWLSNPQQNPIRQRWIDRLHEIGYLPVPGMVQGEG